MACPAARFKEASNFCRNRCGDEDSKEWACRHAPLTVKPNTWYDLRLDVVGKELRAFVNGSQVLQATDSSHASGRGGLVTYKTAAEYMNCRDWQP